MLNTFVASLPLCFFFFPSCLLLSIRLSSVVAFAIMNNRKNKFQIVLPYTVCLYYLQKGKEVRTKSGKNRMKFMECNFAVRIQTVTSMQTVGDWRGVCCEEWGVKWFSILDTIISSLIVTICTVWSVLFCKPSSFVEEFANQINSFIPG